MQDQLIEFETAKLAKEKGFNIFNGAEYFDAKGAEWMGISPFLDDHNDKYPRPTQSLLQKWLREEHQLEVSSHPVVVGSYSFKVYELKEIIHIRYLWGRDVSFKDSRNTDFKSFELALEIGLLRALELIK